MADKVSGLTNRCHVQNKKKKRGDVSVREVYLQRGDKERGKKNDNLMLLMQVEMQVEKENKDKQEKVYEGWNTVNSKRGTKRNAYMLQGQILQFSLFAVLVQTILNYHTTEWTASEILKART